MRIALAVAIALGLGSIVVADPSVAAVRKQTNIPAQGLGPALKEFAASRDLNVLYLSNTVRDLQTSGAAGEITTDEALTKILSGTGLTYRYLNDNTVTIVPMRSAGSPAGGAITTSSGSDDASNATTTSKSERSFWGRLRLAQAPGANSGEATSQNSFEGAPRPSQIEEVIVTAQKREERLIDTPQSVQVLTATEFTKRGATQFRDVADSIPGLTMRTTGAGNNQVSLRGLTAGNDASPLVAVYVDEVPYGSSTGFAGGGGTRLDVGLFDLNRLEVLRGPQGTLYGASTMGGLLKYVTRTPDTTDSSFDVQTGVSSTQHGGMSYNGAATLNAPIASDKAALRATGFYSRDAGYIDNLTLGRADVNQADIYGGRADLLLKPTESLSIRLGAFAQDISRDAEGSANYTLTGAPTDDELEQRRRFEEIFDQRFRLGSATINYDFDQGSLVSISSYQTARMDQLYDVSPTSVALCPFVGLTCSAVGFPFHYSTDKYTQELRFAANRHGSVEWLAGGFYTHETSENEQAFAPRGPAGEPLPNTLFTFSTPSRYEEYAAFGNLTWYLTDKLDLTGGLRYARNDQRYNQIGSGFFGRSAPQPSSLTEDVFTYLANVRYHFSEDVTAYLRYATGYRPGGPNLVTINATTGQPVGKSSFEADRLKSYEVGLKAQIADHRMGVELAAFYTDWTNLQVVITQGGFGAFDNAPGATVRGAELSLSLRPVDALTITGAFSYQDGTLSEAAPQLNGRKDQRLPQSAPLTGTLSLDYALGASTFAPTLGATVRYVDERTAGFGPAPYRLPDFTTVDLRAGATFGMVETQLYLRNVFDEAGQYSLTTRGTEARPSIQQPRTIGISLSARF
jgi:iron complex outermembrane recepter protein